MGRSKAIMVRVLRGGMPQGGRLLGRCAALIAASAAVLSLCGCGGIEFQGKLFDYAGLSGSGNKEDVRMTERAPLLIPPNPKRLPPPGSPPIQRADWPVDSDIARKQVIAAKEEEERKRAAEADPGNPYAGKPTLLDKALGRKKKSSEEEEAALAVPEPDASDKTPQDRARETAVATPQKPVDQSLNAPTPEDDPFHPAPPKSYETMSNPSGNDMSH